MEEQCLSNWDVPAYAKRYIEEIGVTGYIHVSLIDLAMVTGMGPGSEVTVPLPVE